MARISSASLLAISTAALCVAAPAFASTAKPEIVVPASSIEKPSDIGKHAHTCFVTLKNSPMVFRPDTVPGPESPATLRTAYGVPSTDLGQGAIAVVDAYNYSTALSDFNYYSTQAGLAVETSKDVYSASNKVFEVVYQTSTITPPPDPAGTGGWNVEEALDMEMAHGMAPNAKVYLVEANSTSYADLFGAVEKARNLPGVTEVSMSWGGSEFSGENAYDNFMKQAGVTFYAASGDNGAGVIYPSAALTVIGCGGTTLTSTNETSWSGSGGGLSAYETALHYQQLDPGVVAVVGTKRGVPDIAADANPNTGVGVYSTGAWEQVGGTSVATPVIAGIANALDHNYASSYAELSHIYALYGTNNYRDITKSGSRTKVGYDLITGVGTPNGGIAL